MRGRILKRLACIGCPAMLSAAVLWSLLPVRHRINTESCEKLRAGMTRQEVEEILGGPPGDYGPGTGEILNGPLFTMAHAYFWDHPRKSQWLAEDYGISVLFDEQDRVQGFGGECVYRRYNSTWELLLQTLHLRAENPMPDGFYRPIGK